MKKGFGMLALAALFVVSAKGAFASEDVVSLAKSLHRAPVRTCTPDPQGNKYAFCHQECQPYIGGNQGLQLQHCLDNCVARYCNN